MFSGPTQIRSPPKEATLTRSLDNYPQQPNYCPGLPQPQKKIETKQSLLTQTLKSSIISDCGYNSGIYEWRKVQIAPIVRVIELARRSEIDTLTGFSCTHNTIKPEPIQCHLGNFQQFSKEEMLYICKNLLEGHQAIFKKMRATSVSLDKCVVTLDGEVKVWVNQHLERNDISGQILSKEEAITKRIFQTVSFLAQQNIQHKLTDFFQYISASIKKSGKWTFVSLKAMLKSYADCLKIKIAKSITFKKSSPTSRTIKSSMLQQNNPKMFPTTHQSIFQISQRNIQSSMNCSKNSGGNEFTTGHHFPIQLDNLNKNPTCKSINQNERSRTGRVMVRNDKHTNSISLFKTEEDTILERSVHHENNVRNQHRKIPSISDVLAQKIGFSSLPQVQCDDQYSNQPSARRNSPGKEPQNSLKLVIVSQFNLTIDKLVEQKAKPDKQSSISTTNQTSISGNQFCFSKKFKESHMTINMEDKENHNKDNQFRTASRDRFKDSLLMPMSEQAKKVVGSCTNWSTKQNPFDLTTLLKEVKSSKMDNDSEEKTCVFQVENTDGNSAAQESASKMEIQSQVVSFKSITEIKQKFNSLTPVKSTKQIIKQYLKNPLTLLNELRSEQQLESYENTEKNSSCHESPSPSVRKIRVPIEQKILELLQLNRNLVVSTYMETNSEKKIKENETPDKERQKRLKDIEETLSQLVRANLKQQQVLEVNSWTKRLENLLGIEQELKQSISFGPEEANALLREIKMSKLGRIGRDIGESLIPD